MYPISWIDKQIKSFADVTSFVISKNENKPYYKLPYISDIYMSPKKKISEICK